MDIEHLRSIANNFNISFHPAIKEDKLYQKIKEYCEANNMNIDEVMDTSTDTKSEDVKENENDYSHFSFNEVDKKHNKEEADSRTKEAMRLVRCIISCNNKNKTNYKGEIFSVRNAVLPEVKKYVPFNVATHVPQILLNVIKEKDYQLFREETLPNGNKTKRPYLIKEYNIQILPPISTKELEAIKQKQLAEGFTGE